MTGIMEYYPFMIGHISLFHPPPPPLLPVYVSVLLLLGFKVYFSAHCHFHIRLAELKSESEQHLESDLKLAYTHGQTVRAISAQVNFLLLDFKIFQISFFHVFWLYIFVFLNISAISMFNFSFLQFISCYGQQISVLIYIFSTDSKIFPLWKSAIDYFACRDAFCSTELTICCERVVGRQMLS